MFLEINEMKSVMYDYQMNEITENDDTIVAMAIKAAVSQIKSYLKPSNKKEFDDGRPLYDVDKIFTSTGNKRDPLILELCKDIACYRICRLANVDIIHTQVLENYDRAIGWLKDVKSGDANADLPTLDNSGSGDSGLSKIPFRYGSRPKFNHE